MPTFDWASCSSWTARLRVRVRARVRVRVRARVRVRVRVRIRIRVRASALIWPLATPGQRLQLVGVLHHLRFD